jgi:hypothetical protein
MGSSGATLSVLLGQADRSFMRVDGPSSQKRALSVAGGDFDEDGLRDIVNASTGNFVAVHPGNGDGTFRPFTFVPVAWTPMSVLVADLNRDGHDDIAAGTRSSDVIGDESSTISALLGHGDGTFEPFTRYLIEPPFHLPVDLVGGDFDGDGDIDLVVVSAIETIPAQVFRSRGDGTFERGRPLAPVTSRDAGGAPAVGDLDSDGLDDLALCTSGRIAIFRGNRPNLLVSSDSLELVNMQLIECKSADMDGDGDLDLAAVDANGYARVIRNDGDGKFAIPGPRKILTGISPRGLVAARLDADMIPDLAFTESDALVVLRGVGDGTFREPQHLEFTPAVSTLAATHLDGDDIDDLVVALRYPSQVAVFHGSPDGTLVPGQVLAAGGPPMQSPWRP